MKKKLAIIGATLVSAVPFVTFAQGTALTCAAIGAGNVGTLEFIVCKINDIIQIAIPVLILGAVLWFIFGIVKFMTAHDAEEKGAARGTMIHGIIGFAVILGLWGLVNILLHTFGLQGGSGAVQNQFPTF